MTLEFDRRKLKDLIYKIDFLEKSKRFLNQDIQMAYEENSKDLDVLIVRDIIKARKSLKHKRTLVTDKQINEYYLSRIQQKEE